MTFGDKWRKLPASYWDAMAERCVDLPFNDLIVRAALSSGSVIEIGCGAGHFAESVFAAGYTGNYWACDFSPAAAIAARERLGQRATVEVGQFEALSASGRAPVVDVVLARSVIQHQRHWLPLVRAALNHGSRVVLGISRAIYFKEDGEHELTDRKTWFDNRISLEAMQREAEDAGMRCDFERTHGSRGPEVVITVRAA